MHYAPLIILVVLAVVGLQLEPDRLATLREEMLAAMAELREEAEHERAVDNMVAAMAELREEMLAAMTAQKFAVDTHVDNMVRELCTTQHHERPEVIASYPPNFNPQALEKQLNFAWACLVGDATGCLFTAWCVWQIGKRVMSLSPTSSSLHTVANQERCTPSKASGSDSFDSSDAAGPGACS